MESLDPRISRLDKAKDREEKKHMDQLETYEVFVQPKLGRPFRHEGIVHASDEDLAWLFAKEQFSRRQTCTGLWIVKTSNVFASEFTEDDENIYDHFQGQNSGPNNYEVFQLLKRGKQHIHAGSVSSDTLENAFGAASSEFGMKQAFNIWVVQEEDLLRSEEEDIDIWSTLPEKKFRDAIAYRAGDKLKDFLEKRS